MDRQMGETLYYNLLMEVFIQKNLCSRLYLIEIAFWATLWGLKGNKHTPSIARWKARRLPIRHNWTIFAISYGWDVKSGNLSKSACFEGGWVTFSANFWRKGTSHTNHCWYQKTRVITFRLISKYPQCIIWFCDKANVWQTDWRTDRITTANTALECVACVAR